LFQFETNLKTTKWGKSIYCLGKRWNTKHWQEEEIQDFWWASKPEQISWDITTSYRSRKEAKPVQVLINSRRSHQELSSPLICQSWDFPDRWRPNYKPVNTRERQCLRTIVLWNYCK
jgi:hypothetical protein